MYSRHQKEAAKLASNLVNANFSEDTSPEDIILQWCAVSDKSHHGYTTQHQQTIEELSKIWANEIETSRSKIQRVYENT